MAEYVDFHYMPLEGKITGKQVLKQTEDAINDLGQHVYEIDIDNELIQEAIDTSNQAIDTAEAALSAVTTNRAMWFNTVAEMKASDIALGITAATRGKGVFNDGDGAFYAVREIKGGDVDSDDTVFLDNGNVAERIKQFNLVAKGNNIVYVDNVASLRTSDAVVGLVYGTKGYYTDNDCGDGLYVIRTAQQTDVDNGGSIIILDNGNVAELLLGETINVHQFGAKGNANYQDLVSGSFYENVSLTGAVIAKYYNNMDNSGVEKWYANATFTDEGLYEKGAEHYYSATATEAVYEDNLTNKWYVSASFTTEGIYYDNVDALAWYVSATFTDEGIYEYDGKHWYDAEHTIEAPYYDNVADKWYVTAEYTDLAPYHDNIADKWYVSAVYSDEGTYTYDDKYWYITDGVLAPYCDNTATPNKWYVSAIYTNQANCRMNNNYYYGATFSTPANDDTVAIQNAINTHIPIELRNGHGYIVTSFTIYHGFKLIGNGGRLQRPNLHIAPYNYTDNQIKWLRMFDCRASIIGSNVEDRTIEFRDVDIDCNSWYIWNKSSPYQYEQGVIFYLNGQSAHHLKILFDNVHFSNHYASNISVQNYCDVVITKSYSWDCFKGIATVVGGSGSIKISDTTVDSRFNWVAFWHEPNGSTTGTSEYVNINNCYFSGILQGLAEAHSTTIIANTTLYITRFDDDMTIAPRTDAVYMLTNCSIICPEYSSFTIKLRGRGSIIINGCDIKGAGFLCKYSTANDYTTNIMISGCKIHESKTGVLCDATGAFNIAVSDCEFRNITDRVFGASLVYGAATFNRFIITNCLIDTTGYVVYLEKNGGKMPVFNGGNDVINPDNRGIFIYGKNKIFMKNEYWSVPVKVSKYRSGNSWVAVGFGYRMTYVTEAPTFVGINNIDHAQLTVSPYTKYSYVNNAWVADA